jgi:pyroglutamyl-peptidase
VTILVTCFEPFGGRKTNLSELAVEKLRSRKTPVLWNKENVVFACLPVTFDKVEGILKTLIKKHSVTRILLTGEHRKAPQIQLERLALNVAHADIADNSGTRYNLAEIAGTQSLALMTALSLDVLNNKIKKAGIPNRISHHCGTFVCNAAYYHALQNCKDSIFIHFPAKFGVPAKNAGVSKAGKSHIDCLADALNIALEFMEERTAQ